MKKCILLAILIALFQACNTDDIQDNSISKTYKILALGDSYTIGESVCDSCRFPEQLKDSLIKQFNTNDIFNLKVIARTGWTTTNLINAINDENLNNNQDLVTLLIGVNNQYQNLNFSIYEEEFPILLENAIALAQGDANKVMVISIPDYVYTPFGQAFNFPETTSQAIDNYNNFAEAYCAENNVTFINITDITRQGLVMPTLVASDGLHPSEIAYSLFVERFLPVALDKIQ